MLRRHSFTKDRLVAKRKPPRSETLNTVLKVEGDDKWTNVHTGPGCLRAVGAIEGFRFALWTDQSSCPVEDGFQRDRMGAGRPVVMGRWLSGGRMPMPEL